MLKIQLLALLALTATSSMAAPFAPFETQVAWSKKQIQACFGGPQHQRLSLVSELETSISTFSHKEKVAIKEIINQEFTLNSVGLEFTGWNDCDNTASNGDLIVFKDRYSETDDNGALLVRGGVATIGEGGSTFTITNAQTKESYQEMRKSSSPLKPFAMINTVLSLSKRVGAIPFIQLTALHEFGHVAGLRHEHLRLESAKNDPNCKQTPTIPLHGESINRSTRFSGDYDPNSIMNYCFYNSIMDVTGLSFRSKNPQKELLMTDPTLFTTKAVGNKTEVNIRIGLSELDKKAVRCLYFYNDEQKKELCNRTK